MVGAVGATFIASAVLFVVAIVWSRRRQYEATLNSRVLSLIAAGVAIAGDLETALIRR